ncbi:MULTISPECIES: hypothetical protein [Bradyrhizobium]|uniref:Uncharacterized protein n=2 Tax=Bradyrhizobium TaxID=374 RepID=A0ABY0Q9B1_9BRAD|nr:MULTISPECIES: hypothetical protein [Bradyrhizobium]SDJ73262.1 hypothetical protein SAMN05444163_6296 [Bradyrhizobium ottawaense]SEC19599.1 hypothetical protein SAMN05444171_0863 [Bradyrhizobium lablabi]
MRQAAEKTSASDLTAQGAVIDDIAFVAEILSAKMPSSQGWLRPPMLLILRGSLRPHLTMTV